MRAMFTMMNGARLGVGMQGLGLAEVSYQNAVAYTRERLQGRSARGPAMPNAEADPIIVHPDVRRMLMTMKAHIEGMRALTYWVGTLIDVEERHPDAGRREEAADLVALMTPVIKAFCTDLGFEMANLALQCFGGHGYIREYGMEQFVRDARIAQIYEGTNGVQAMDLLGRKVLADQGRQMGVFLDMAGAFAEACSPREAMREFAQPLAGLVADIRQLTRELVDTSAQDPHAAGAAAAPYLRLVGHLALAWSWARMAEVALRNADSTDPIYASKIATARFYFQRLLPQTAALSREIRAGSSALMEPLVELF